MRGLQGMMIAAGLGIVGAICNWFYISQQARDLKKVSFVAVSPSAQINPGDAFKSEHLVQIEIPERYIGNLDKVAIPWDARDTVVGERATKSYISDEIILQQDLRTAAQQDLNEKLGANEALYWVPVDQRTFVAQHVNPGDHVSFIVGRGLGRTPTPAGNADAAAAENETIGPFEVLTLGRRKGRTEFQQTQGGGNSSENVIGIRIGLDKGSEPNELAQRLASALSMSGNQGVQVILHSSRSETPQSARR